MVDKDGTAFDLIADIGYSDGEIDGFFTKLVFIRFHENHNLFVDMFASGKLDICALRIRYIAMQFDMSPGGDEKDINPFSPRRAYRVITHIEREAYIENPVRDLYRAVRHQWC